MSAFRAAARDAVADSASLITAICEVSREKGTTMDDALVERMAEAVVAAGCPVSSAKDIARAALAVAEPDIAALRAERDALARRVEALEEALKWLAADSIDPDSRRIARVALEPRE